MMISGHRLHGTLGFVVTASCTHRTSFGPTVPSFSCPPSLGPFLPWRRPSALLPRSQAEGVFAPPHAHTPRTRSRKWGHSRVVRKGPGHLLTPWWVQVGTRTRTRAALRPGACPPRRAPLPQRAVTGTSLLVGRPPGQGLGLILTTCPRPISIRGQRAPSGKAAAAQPLRRGPAAWRGRGRRPGSAQNVLAHTAQPSANPGA